jgi:hypothetical protein
MCDIEPLNLDWGVSLKEAKHTTDWQCVHEGCPGWSCFMETDWPKYIVGFHFGKIVIRCEKCGRFLWAHGENIANITRLSPRYPGPESQPSRRAYYNLDLGQDNDELWGLNPAGVDAKHASDYRCPHEGCNWRFEHTHQNSKLWPYAVGWDYSESKLTIRCPYCSRYMWVHETDSFNFASESAADLAKMFRPICPNWPQSQQQPETKE